MAGFSGAVEDGVRGIGMVVSFIAALATGLIMHSFALGFGVFVVGNVVAMIWAKMAGDDFRAAQFQDTRRDREVDP